MNVLLIVANGIAAVLLLALREDVADMFGSVRLCTVKVLFWYIVEFSTRLRNKVDVIILVEKVGNIPVLFMVATEERFLLVVEGNTNVGVWDT